MQRQPHIRHRKREIPARLLRAALPIPTQTPRNSPAHRPPLASPSFSGRRGLPPDSLCLRETGFALPTLYWRFRLVTVCFAGQTPARRVVLIPAVWHRPQGVTVPAAALRPRAASGESDAGAPPLARGYPASASPLHAGTTPLLPRFQVLSTHPGLFLSPFFSTTPQGAGRGAL